MDESENEDHESTFFDSNYKETPKDDKPNLQVSYNLRSRRPDNQMSTEKDGAERTSNNNSIQHFGDLLELSNQTASMNKMTHQKANNQKHKVDLKPKTVKKSLPPVLMKQFAELPYQPLIVGDKSTQQGPKTKKSKSKSAQLDQIPCTKDQKHLPRMEINSLISQGTGRPVPFMVVQEADFPQVFQDPILKKQKLLDYNDEIDYESGPELIAKNRKQLLKSLTGSIERYITRNPMNYIGNIKLIRDLD